MIWKTKEILTFLLKNWYKDNFYEIKRKSTKSLRSIAQTRYYFWVIVKMISQYHWYSPVETHELLKLTCSLETTTNLTTDEFSFMCNMIRDMWLNKFNFYIPEPNEVEELKSLAQYLF